MYTLSYASIICALLTFLCILNQIHRQRSCRYPVFIDYPFIGMLLPLIQNMWRIHDFITERLIQLHKTAEFKGPWFTNMNFLMTSDPINVHHIMSKSFDNYVKGPEFCEIFEPFGDGIFTSDSDKWKYHRSLLHSVFKQREFEILQEKILHTKLETSLLPMLDHVEKQGSVLDLQDVFSRLTFDNICSITIGCDPKCLSIDFPYVVCEKAFDQIEEGIFYRHVTPKFIWKLQKFLGISHEKKMTKACKEFDQFIYASIESKKEELRKGSKNIELVDLLTHFMRKDNGSQHIIHDDKFLRDSAFNLIAAGRDTITSGLTWFFYLVSTHPLVETKILEEIKENFKTINIEKKLSGNDLKKLVYLHGAICETLRLFPPVPFERKQVVKGDILPSGHIIDPNTMVLFSLYLMGRFEDIWGKDCLEFKPERWISERGKIVHQPSYKFSIFNAGPRTCLGKDFSFIQLKMIATSILCNYRVHVVQGHIPTPSHSIILHSKNGLKVRITKRQN
ncbi:alkane hydroxylase MAH1-like [Cicer arietinum]|uniref:Alkane hydroxylase MAH1-like n=1 Tax=Cicer arietinum TaxID=3827 RepID=A0A3Q7X0Z3_CICAR|nr:alkane hydroxylase MAH1-like [Cicer arietinum]